MAVQDDIIQNIVLAGQQEVIAGFGAIQKAGVTAFEAINGAAATSTTVLGGLATAMGGVAAAVGIVSIGMLSWVRSATQGVIAMGNFAEETGTTIDNLSTFSVALGKAGSDTSNLTNAIRRLAVRVETDWGIIQKSSREAADKYIADQLRIKQANLALEESSRRLADVEKANALERGRAALNLKEANVNLAEAQLRFRAVILGDTIDPEEVERLNRRKEFLRLEQAIQQQAEAAHRAQRQAAEEQAKAAEAAIDVELKRLHLSQARTKATEDEANSVSNLKKFIDDLAAGIDVSGSKINRTYDNILRGLIASVGPAVQGLQEFKGSIGDLTSTSPALFSVILKLSDVMKNTHDETLNLALAVAAFGRGVDPTFVHAMAGGKEGLLAMIRELKALGLALDDDQLKIARDFKKALSGFRTDIDLVSKQFALLFAPQFGQIFAGLDQALIKNRVGILNFGEAIRDGVQPYLDTFLRVLTGAPIAGKDDWLINLIDGFKRFGSIIATTIGVLGTFFRVILTGADLAATAINKAFGSELTGTQILGFAAALGVLAVTLGPLARLIGGVGVAVAGLSSALLLAVPAILAFFAGFASGIFIINRLTAVFDKFNATWLGRQIFGDPFAAVRKSLEESGLSAEEVDKEIKKLQTTLEKTSDTPLDNLKDLFSKSLEGITAAVAKAQEDMRKLGTSSEDSAQKSADAWSTSTKKTFSDLDKMVAEALAAQKKLATGAQQAASEVSKAARQGVQILKVPAAGETPEVAPGSRIQQSIRTLPGAAAATAAKAEVTAGPTDEAVKKSQDNADTIQKAWDKALNEIVTKAKSASDDINKAFTDLSNKIRANWLQLKADLITVFSDLGVSVGREFEKIRISFDLMAQAVTNRVQVLVKNIRDAFITSQEDIIGPKQQGLFDSLAEAFGNAGAKAISGFSTVFLAGKERLVAAVLDNFAKMVDEINKLLKDIRIPEAQPAQPAQPATPATPAPAQPVPPTVLPPSRPGMSPQDIENERKEIERSNDALRKRKQEIDDLKKQQEELKRQQPLPDVKPKIEPLPGIPNLPPDREPLPLKPKLGPFDTTALDDVTAKIEKASLKWDDIVKDTFKDKVSPGIDLEGFSGELDRVKKDIEDFKQLLDQALKLDLDTATAQLAVEDLKRAIEGVQTALDNVQQAAAGLGTSAGDFNELLQAVDRLKRALNDAAQASSQLQQQMQQLQAPDATGWDGIVVAMQSFGQALSSAQQAAVGLAQALADAATQAERLNAAQPQGGSPPGPGPPVPTSARGGLFRGIPGIDKNLVMLSDFEYVMRPEAVSRYGVAFMDMINSMRFPGYRAGGMVLRGLATGGSTGRGQQATRALHITIGDDTFRDLVAPESTARALERAAVARSASSTGVKPRWRR